MNDMNNKNDFFIRKRIINHRNKQIETRIKRQIIIEDGVMISDSGPQVTTKTIEDTRQELEEFDMNGHQTHYSSDDFNVSNDDENVVNDTKKCNKLNNNKT
ncbi:hypothetical protein BLA29_011140 [Euroglyphus maynei]|uniref:Uncharacterized protein n=1 Tax=Euroglyphus maynei TaxID=6958 RepID=A0A1Y3BCX3_EURMA|nr:hypothetical protein BLA29_011140 [Euroglyphus maynei]